MERKFKHTLKEQQRGSRGLATRGRLVSAWCWLAASFATVHGDCVDDGTCAIYNRYSYKTLDGTPRDQSTYGCQTSYLPIPEGWELVGYDADGRHVASSYNWGTLVIVHCTAYSYSCATNTKLRSGSVYGYRIYTSTSAGITSYKPSGCQMRILIRQLAEVNCSKGEGSVYTDDSLKCTSCPAGRFSHGGINAVCQPTLAYAASDVISSPPTDFTAEHDVGGIVRFTFSATTLPVVYEPVRLEYVIDMKPNESSLDLQGPTSCQQNYWSNNTIGNETDFTAVLTYTDLNGDCNLGLNTTKDLVERKGIVAVALVVSDDDGAFEGIVKTWYFPVVLQLPASMEAIHDSGIITAGGGQLQDRTVYSAEWADSTLVLYESNAYQSWKQLPIYQAGERCYAELTLVDSAGLILTPTLAWVSTSSEASQAMLHNLTESIVPLGYGSAGKSQAHFSVVLQPCVNCFLHVEGEISTRRLGDAEDIAINEGRQLEFPTVHHTLHSVPITVEEVRSRTEETPADDKATGVGSEEDRTGLLALAAGAAALAVLLIACGSVLIFRRLKAELCEIKYKPAALEPAPNDPEVTPTDVA